MKTSKEKSELTDYAKEEGIKSPNPSIISIIKAKEPFSFGVLEVLKVSVLAGGEGYETHFHSNIEIVTIPLDGELEYKDSLGNYKIIKPGDVQVLSAGTGIFHYEFNYNKYLPVTIIQIGIIPKINDIEPRYQQYTFNPESGKSNFQQIISPYPAVKEVWINQDAWFYMVNMQKGQNSEYKIKKNGNGIYILVIEGALNVQNINLKKGESITISNLDSLNIIAESKSELLMIDLPFSVPNE